MDPPKVPPERKGKGRKGKGRKSKEGKGNKKDLQHPTNYVPHTSVSVCSHTPCRTTTRPHRHVNKHVLLRSRGGTGGSAPTWPGTADDPAPAPAMSTTFSLTVLRFQRLKMVRRLSATCAIAASLLLVAHLAAAAPSHTHTLRVGARTPSHVGSRAAFLFICQ